MTMYLTSTIDSAILSREKWSVLGLALLGDILCITIGIIFCSLGLATPAAPQLFPLCFGAVFAGLGLFHLALLLPHQIQNIFANDGLQVVIANAQGVTLTRILGVKPEYFEWDDIEEIVLARELKIIDVDETSFMWNVMIIFFKPDRFLANKSVFDYIKMGISVSRNRRAYTMTNYPADQQNDMQLAIQRFFKQARIISYNKALFDLKNTATIHDQAAKPDITTKNQP